MLIKTSSAQLEEDLALMLGYWSTDNILELMIRSFTSLMELITNSTSSAERMEKYFTSPTKTKLSVKLVDLLVLKHGFTTISLTPLSKFHSTLEESNSHSMFTEAEKLLMLMVKLFVQLAVLTA